MANSVDMYLNIHNTLNKELDQSLRKMSSFNDKLSSSGATMSRIGDKWKGTNDLFTKSTRTFGKLFDVTKRLVPAIGAIFGGGLVLQGAREVIRYSQTFRELSHQMGDGAKHTNEFSKSMTDAAFATGLAVEDVGDMVTSLRELKVPLSNLEEATIITSRFSEVTGVTATETARLYGELIRTGRMSQDMADTTLAGMAKVQRAFGLSSREMDSLSSGVVSITQRMNQLGKSATDTVKMTKETTALAVAFSKVGIEVEKAVDLVDDLLNPDRVEENAFLYAKLGISIGDAFAGNVDVAQMVPRMAELGKQMKDMSGPAAAAMAKSLGMPLNVLRQFGEISLGLEDQKELAKLMGEEGMSAGEALKQMQKETRGLDKIFGAIRNTLQTISSKVAVTLGDKLTGVVDKLRALDVEKIANRISSMASGVLDFFIKIPVLLPLIGVGLLKVFSSLRKKAYSVFVDPVKDMTKELTTAMTGALDMGKSKKGIVDTTKATPRKESGASGVFSPEAIQKRNKARTEENQLLYEFARAKKKTFEENIDAITVEQEAIQKRLEYLDEQKKALGEDGNLSHKLTIERIKLSEISAKNEDKLIKLERERNRASILEETKRFNLIKHGSEESIIALYKESHARAELNYQEHEKLKKVRNEEFERLKINKEALVLLESEQRAARESGRGEDLARISEKMREINSLNVELSAHIEEQNSAIKDAWESRKQELDIIKEIEEIHGKIDITAPDYTGQGNLTTRIMTTFSQLYDNVKVGVLNAASNINSSFSNILGTAKEKIASIASDLRDNTARTLFKAGKDIIAAPLKGVGKMLSSNIGRLVGPMAIMGLAMKMLQPVMKELQPVIEVVSDTLKNVLVKLLEAIGPPILRILSALMPVLAFLVNTALPPIIMALGGLMTIMGVLVKSVGSLIGVISKKARDTVSEIGAEITEGGKEAFKVGASFLSKENKIISKETVEGIQSSLTNTADRFASGGIVLTTKPEKEKFKGGEIYLDEDGNIRIKKDIEKSVVEDNKDKNKYTLTQEDLNALALPSHLMGAGLGFTQEVLEELKKGYYQAVVDSGGLGALFGVHGSGGTSIDDGIIFKDNRIVRTHEDDNIIATKSTPQINKRSTVVEREAEGRAETIEIVSSLREIIAGIGGLLNEGKKSSESLERINNASNRTANNLRGPITPSLERI